MKLKIFGLFIAVVVTFLSAGSIYAQCGVGVIRRGPVAVYNPVVVHETPVVVHHEEIVTPIAVPVLIPAYQFQYTPPCAVPVQAGYVGQSGVNPGYGQPVAGQNYAQPMPGYGQPAYNQAPSGYGPSAGQAGSLVNDRDKIRELAKALLEELQKQPQGNVEGDDGPPVAPGSNLPPSAPINQPKTGQPPGLPTAPSITPDQAAPAAIAALQRNCSGCHTGPASKGEFVIFAQPGLFNQNIPWRSIVREIDAGRMPPKDSQFRLQPQDAVAIRAWLSGI